MMPRGLTGEGGRDEEVLVVRGVAGCILVAGVDDDRDERHQRPPELDGGAEQRRIVAVDALSRAAGVHVGGWLGSGSGLMAPRYDRHDSLVRGGWGAMVSSRRKRLSIRSAASSRTSS